MSFFLLVKFLLCQSSLKQTTCVLQSGHLQIKDEILCRISFQNLYRK